MQRLHEDLSRRWSWYKGWHSNSGYAVFHWLVFLLFGVLVTSFFTANINDTYGFQDVYQRSSPSLKSLTAQLLQSSGEYARVSGQEKSQALIALTSIAKQRRAALLSEIQSQPLSALAHSLPQGLLQILPVEISNLVEKQQELTGVFIDVHVHRGPDPDHETIEEVLMLKESQTDKIYKLYFGSKEFNSGYFNATVKIKGVVVDDQVAVSEIHQQVQAAMIGNKRVAVLLYKLSDTTPTASVEDFKTLVFGSPNSTAAFYSETSYGQASISGDVFGWYSIPYNSASCNTYSWGQAVDAAATAAGVDLNSYDKIIYVNAPMLSGNCNIISSAALNGKWAWVSGNYWTRQHLYVHELGHTLGLSHAAGIVCGNKTIDVYGNCASSEYSDPSDVMGAGNTSDGKPFQFNAPHKDEIGWLSSTQVQAVTAGGTYVINKLETGENNVKALKINKPDTEESYYVSYRQPVGTFDSQMTTTSKTLYSGAYIHISPSTPGLIYRKTLANVPGTAVTFLPDNTLGDGTSYNASLTNGATYVDMVNGIMIHQDSHDANSVTVSVQFVPPTCGRLRPDVPSPNVPWGAPGQKLSYSFAIKNLDSAACGDTTFGLSAVAPEGWSISTPSSVTLAPHTSTTVTVSVTSPVSAPNGMYDFSLRTADPANLVHNISTIGYYYVYNPPVPVDTTAPKVYINAPINGTTLKGASTTIKVVSGDNVGVTKTELYINGLLVSQTAASALSYKWNIKNLAKGTTHTLVAKAYDAAGNIGVSSTVTVKK